jgi:hypothetical protein
MRPSRIDIELLDVAHAAISETLQSGGPASAILGQLEAFLAPSQYMVWKGDGPGLGRELKRSYSNIHGRYFGRYYLEKHESVFGLVPIEGSYFAFGPHAVVRLKDGEKGDMPDWVGWNADGFVVAESKGTYAGGDWSKSFSGWNALPQCLQKAQQQLDRVQIDNFGIALNVKFKGWSVASRWATQNNGLEPWLAAIDPLHGEADIPQPNFERVVAAMQSQVYKRMLVSLGLQDGEPSGVSRGSESTLEERPIVPEHFMRTIRFAADESLTGVSAAVGAFGFAPISGNDDLVYLRTLPVGARPVWVVTLEEKPLRMAAEGVFFSNNPTRRTPFAVGRNGVTVSRFDAIERVADV